jgi:hypothetical protein
MEERLISGGPDGKLSEVIGGVCPWPGRTVSCQGKCWWKGLDSNQCSRKARDLQSRGFNHSPTLPRAVPAGVNLQAASLLDAGLREAETEHDPAAEGVL